MAKEKVYIVLSHKHSLKKGTKNDWEVTETVEFVNQLRNKHTSMSSAIGDFINKKMLTGAKVGMSDYEYFMAYVYKKYPKQMAQLDAAYPSPEVEEEDGPELVTDSFGNIRPKTVFDPA